MHSALWPCNFLVECASVQHNCLHNSPSPIVDASQKKRVAGRHTGVEQASLARMFVRIDRSLRLSKREAFARFMGSVQLQSALMGLTFAFKQKYDDDALKIAEVFGEQMGTRLGNQTREKAGIKGSSIQDIARERERHCAPESKEKKRQSQA